MIDTKTIKKLNKIKNRLGTDHFALKAILEEAKNDIVLPDKRDISINILRNNLKLWSTMDTTGSSVCKDTLEFIDKHLVNKHTLNSEYGKASESKEDNVKLKDLPEFLKDLEKEMPNVKVIKSVDELKEILGEDSSDYQIEEVDFNATLDKVLSQICKCPKCTAKRKKQKANQNKECNCATCRILTKEYEN